MWLHKIVSIGAWTGQAAIVQWLVTIKNATITALVTTTDNWWSSALIRQSLNIPSPWDVRNVINAINTQDDIRSQLLNYRFSEWELTGTHLWNLIVWALSRICGSYEAWILELNKRLWLWAYVLPISNHPAQICVELEDGTHIQWERQIIKREKRDVKIKRYYLDDVQPAVQDGIDAIQQAHALVICPGVVGTGIISTLLFGWIKEAIQQNPTIPIIYIANVMTYPSQTTDMTLSDHVHQIEAYLWRKVTHIIVNTTLPPKYIVSEYNRVWATPLILDTEKLSEYTIITWDLLINYEEEHNAMELVRASWTEQNVWVHLIRHDWIKVAEIVKSILSSS